MLEGIFTVFIKMDMTVFLPQETHSHVIFHVQRDSQKAWHGLKGQIRKESV